MANLFEGKLRGLSRRLVVINTVRFSWRNHGNMNLD